MELKLGDFGLATHLDFDGERKRTVCGTPNYIAPEIIDGGDRGHSFEVDIWSLGVIVYTLLVGRPPFETNDVKATYKRIKLNQYTFPDGGYISANAKDLIKKILVTEPEKRLTLEEILAHDFLLNQELLPTTLPTSTLVVPPNGSYQRNFGSSRK